MNDSTRLDNKLPVPSQRHDELYQQLADKIDMARLAPGKSVTVEMFMRCMAASKAEMLPVIASLLENGLLIRTGDDLHVSPVDSAYLRARLDKRQELELTIVEAAAANAGQFAPIMMLEALTMMRRSALVGDIEGFMMADRRLEKEIAAASGLPELCEEFFTIKREFRRGWLAYNRLRDFNGIATMRARLVEAILRGNSADAIALVRQIIDALRPAF